MEISTTKQDSRTCPFCAETIKASAVRCKHCHADLGQKIVVPNHRLPSEKGLGWTLKLAAALALLVAAFLGYGFYLSSTPEGKATDRERAVIDLCRHDLATAAAEMHAFISQTCEKLENEFRRKHGIAP